MSSQCQLSSHGERQTDGEHCRNVNGGQSITLHQPEIATCHQATRNERTLHKFVLAEYPLHCSPM